MLNLKYINEYTDETTIETLKTHGALSVRTANVLMWRGHFNTIGEIKHLKEEDVLLLRNAGRKAAYELAEFQAIYNNREPERQKQKRLISADDLIAYCKKCGDVVQGMADEIITKIGHGESEISALSGCAFFLQQARIYKFDLPNAIESFIREGENETK